MVGRTISHYRILSQLGAGGMGVVYQAEDIRLGREVAVKFVSEDFADDAEVIERLRFEARAASALNHPNICTIFDVGDFEGRPFFVMEMMKGQTLRDRLLSSGPLRPHHLVDIGIVIADALHSTHSDGIIHRDIKPGNIFLTDRGQVKVLDFGLAKATRAAGVGATTVTAGRTGAGATLGTIAYMSPEQATGEALDGRTDLFSLGVVLYESATGRHPFPGKTPALVFSAILNRAPQPPTAFNEDLPLRLQEIISNCLEKDRELRYQSAADLRADLKRLRRDLDSGHAHKVSDASAAWVPTEGAASSGRGALTTSSDSAPSASSRPAANVAAKVPSRRGWMPAAAAAAAVAVALGMYAWWPDTAAPPVAGTNSGGTPALSQGAIDNRLVAARASLTARNYRSARTSAEEVLAADPTNAEAARIRDEADARLSEFDAAIAEARQQLAAGNVQATARALETARDLDAAAPSILDLSSRLSDLIRERDAAARASARPLASPAPPPSVPARQDTAPAARSDPGPASSPSSTTTPPTQTASAAPTVQPPAQPPATAATPARPALAPVLPAPALTRPPAGESAGTTPREPTPPTPANGAAADEAAIRGLVANYGRAIETKDIKLFRSVKPNLSADEERRVQQGFDAVTSQQVNLSIVSLNRQGDQAVVVVGRRDVIRVDGRQQTVDSRQRLIVARDGARWVITDIQ